ncbi:hypothetical protein V8F33_003266 [Rhypophila sp. PSN 637]
MEWYRFTGYVSFPPYVLLAAVFLFSDLVPFFLSSMFRHGPRCLARIRHGSFIFEPDCCDAILLTVDKSHPNSFLVLQIRHSRGSNSSLSFESGLSRLSWIRHYRTALTTSPHFACICGSLQLGKVVRKCPSHFSIRDRRPSVPFSVEYLL